ncbi:MAG: hypothetical protein ACRDLB_14535 [Actinomycetota bacterium]
MRLDQQLVARLAAVAVVLVAISLTVAGAGKIVSVPRQTVEPGAVEAILLVQPVVVAVRLAVIAVATYLVASIVALVIEGRWLVKAGVSGAEAEPSALALGYQEGTGVRLDLVDSAINELWEAIDAMEDRVYEEDDE